MARVVKSPVIVALDFDNAGDVLALVDRLDPRLCRLKVGKELFTREGPALVRQLVGRDFDVFLDLKFHDIPNTVAAAVTAAAGLGVWMVNVHATGGRRMLRAAREALASIPDRPLLTAVTVLTSMSDADLRETGCGVSVWEQVLRLATLSHEEGLDGVVCAAREAGSLRDQLGDAFLRVTPGIRPAEDAAGDQRRVATPAQAMADGSSYLVIGRPITRAADPAAKLDRINRELGV